MNLATQDMPRLGRVRFGVFEFDMESHEPWRGDEAVPLTARSRLRMSASGIFTT